MIIELPTFAGGEWRKYHLIWDKNPGKRRGVPPEAKRQIFREQGCRCAFCQKSICIDPADFDCDHIVPVKYGGPTCRSNLQLLCVRCHRKKSALERRREINVCNASVTMYMSGDAVRVSPHDISTLVETSSGVYCLEFGDLRIKFAPAGHKKRPVVTDAMRKKQKQTRIAHRDLLERVDVTKMGKEGYNLLLKRKTSRCATTEDLAKIQTNCLVNK